MANELLIRAKEPLNTLRPSALLFFIMYISNFWIRKSRTHWSGRKYLEMKETYLRLRVVAKCARTSFHINVVMWFYKYGAVWVQGSVKLQNPFNFTSLVWSGRERAHACDPMSAPNRKQTVGKMKTLSLKHIFEDIWDMAQGFMHHLRRHRN